MKIVLEFLFVVILFYYVYSYPDQRCPYPSERRIRSRWVCNSMSTEKYTCLYNAIQQKHEESCKFKPVISEEGKEYHISVYPDPVSCKNQKRYQPFRLRSNITSECVLLKSTCSDEGQYLFNHGSATNDNRCGCDFQKGFGFVNKTKRPCDCIPSIEDCTCYMKKNTCLSGFMLSSDYKCIHVNNKTYVSPCPGVGPHSRKNDTQSLRRLQEKKTKENGRRMSKIPLTILVVVCIIYVFCIFTWLLTDKIPRCLTSEISPPFGLKAYQNRSSLTLSWSKKSERYISHQIQGFKIYHTYNDNWDDQLYEMVAEDIMQYNFGKLLPSRTYRFKIATCFSNLVESKCCEQVTVDTERPTPPEQIKVTAIEDTVEVSWMNPQHPVFEFVKDFIILFEECGNITRETVEKDKSSFLQKYCKEFTTYKARIVTRTVNGVESEPSQVVETKTKDFSRTERENYLRLSELIRNVAYRVIKDRFDEEYPISDPGKWFQHNRITLESHLPVDQMQKLLLEIKKGNFKDMVFDIHLLSGLFVCLKGWPFTKTHRHKSQNDENSSEISYLHRIQRCLTQLEKTKNNKISSKEFESLWIDVSQAIIRLGGEQYKSWCESIRVNQTLKQENEETWMYSDFLQISCKETYNMNRAKEIIQTDLEQVKKCQNEQQQIINDLIQTQKSLQTGDDKIKQGDASSNVCPVSHQLMINRWKEDNKRFNEIKVVSDIVSMLSKGTSCITITGIPGIGKTATLHHVALYLNEVKQYTIVPCINPDDVRTYYKQNQLQVFVFDDICGKYSVNLTKVNILLYSEEFIKDIMKGGKSKVLSSCRLQVLQEPEFKQLDFIIGRVFDMSNKYQHSVHERLRIAHEYLDADVIEQLKANIITYSCFPLKCKLFAERRRDDPLTFFKNHFDVYTDELDRLEKLPDKSKYCALFLLVVFNGCVDGKSLIAEAPGELPSHTNTQVKSICAKYRVDHVSKIETKMESFLNVYVKKINNKFLVIHDTMLDFFCSYFGRKSQKEFIQFADIRVLQERTVFASLIQSQRTESNEFTVDISEENNVLYFNRLMTEMKFGNIQEVFYNRQMKYHYFRKMMIQAMNKRDNTFLRQLFVTPDHDKSCEIHGINYFTPLSLASYLGYDDIVQFMMPFIDKQYLELFDAIKMSCVAGHASVLRLLIEKDRVVKLTNKEANAFCFLKLASIKGRQNIVDILIKAGYQVDCSDSDGMNPLMFACLYDHKDVVNMLIKNGLDINRRNVNGETALRIACDNENFSVVKTLIRSGANVNIANERGITPLMASCEKGNVHLVKLLLKANADVNKKGQYFTSNVENMLNTFLDSLIDMHILEKTNKDGWTALHIAVICGHTNIVESLIQFRAEIDLVNGFGLSPIMLACITGNIDIITLLFNENADINKQDKSGRTCIMTACDKQNIVAARFLLSKRPHLEKSDSLGRSAINIACCHGNYYLVEELIKYGACINSCDISGNTCINMICCEENVKILTILIERGADVNKQDKKGWTPLNKTSHYGNEIAVKLLVEHCAVVDEADNEGWTPLMSACKMGHAGIVKYLLDKDAKTDYLSKTGYTPLMVASQCNQVEIIQLLLDAGADLELQNERGTTALGLASYSGNINSIQLLISNGADVTTTDSKGFSPLKIASSLGHTNAVITLIKAGADTDIADTNGWTPLKSACKQGHLPVVSFLITNKANINAPDKEGWTPLKIASLSGHTQIVEMLLDSGANIDQADNVGWSPLMSACQGGHTDIVLMLIQKGATINHVSLEGHTPIGIACKHASIDVLQLLISHEANLETADKKGLTPLRIACDQVQLNKVKLLISYGVDVNHVDENKVSPLNAACKYGECSIVEFLLNANASIDVADNQGHTPLLSACEFGHLQIVKLLVKMNCDIQHANFSGWSPLLVAVRENYVDIINTLMTKGASIGMEDLFVACKNGYVEIVKLLIKTELTLNAENEDGLCPLMLSLKYQQFEVVDYLISVGADLRANDDKWNALIRRFNSDGSTLLTKACSTGYEQIVRLIILHTIDFSKIDQNGRSPITSACYGGHKPIVQILLENGVQLNEVDGSRQTPFMVALERNHVHIIEFLISMGLDLNGIDATGCTPLTNTCRKNQLAILEILISKGADINKVGTNKKTPLEIACEGTHWQCVDLLLKNGANFDCCKKILKKMKNNIDILHLACQNGLKDVCLALVKDFDINGILKTGDSLLTSACKHGMIAIVHLLCSEGASIDKEDGNFRTALELACQGEYINIIDYLIDRGACIDVPNHEGYTPLMIACLTGKYLVVKTLVERGGETNQIMGSESLISAACSKKHYDVIDFLLDSGIDIKRAEHDLNNLTDQHYKDGLDLLAIACTKGLKALTYFLISSLQYSNKIVNESFNYLKYACNSGHESIISLLSSKGFDINQYSDHGVTLLHLACAKGHLNIVKSLIRMKVNVNKTDDNGLSPLHMACVAGKDSVVLSLIHAEATMNSKDNDGVTPLSVACYISNIKIVKILVGNNATTNICDTMNCTPLMISCMEGHKEISEFLIKSGACVNSIDLDGWTALQIACNEGKTEIAEILIENGANIDLSDVNGWSPLKLACMREQESVVELLLQKGANIQECDKGTSIPLMVVCQTNNLNILKLLLDQNIDVNFTTADGKTALRKACEDGHFKVARMLLEKGADVMKSDKDKLTPLHAVCAPSLNKYFKAFQDKTMAPLKGCKSVIVNPVNLNMRLAELLIEFGAAVNEKTSKGETPLMLACLCDKHDLIAMLINKGANINEVNKEGMTALSISSEVSNVNVVKLLLDKGALPNKENNFGDTPLHLICRQMYENENLAQLQYLLFKSNSEVVNSLETIKLLIEKGANINHPNSFGFTPLICASLFENLQMMETLIDHGADISRKDKCGRTVFFTSCVSPSANFKIIQYLVENGANIDDVDEDGDSPLNYLCNITSKDDCFTITDDIDSLLQIFLRSKTEPTSIENSFEQVIENKIFMLVETGANVNKADNNGWTPLMCACVTQKTKIVELLMTIGARIDDANDNGQTALNIGCNYGYCEIVNMLVEEANVNKCCDEGYVPLHHACWLGNESIVTKLLQKSANVNHSNNDGWTPLMFACQNGFLSIVKLLLEHGANVTWYSDDRSYPLQLAIEGNYKSIENLLNEYGAYLSEDDD